MKEIFENFLNSNEKVFNYIKEDDKNSNYHIVKLPYNDYIDILYMTRTYGKNLSNYDKLEYCGFYDKENKELYDISYSLCRSVLKLELEENPYKTIGFLANEFNEKLNEIIKDYVLENKKEFYDSVKDYESNMSKSSVYNYFMKDMNFVDFDVSYNLNEFNDILSYKSLGEEYLIDKAIQIIERDKEYIGKKLVDIDKTNEILQEILNDKNDIIYKRKDIVNSMKNEDFSNVHVFINKDGIDFDFKYPKDALENWWNSSYLSSYNMEAKERNSYYDLFGRYEDFNYEDIYKIEYRNKPIYEDLNFIKVAKSNEEFVLE